MFSGGGGSTEVEVNVPTRVALAAAFVFLGEFIATLVVVSVPEVGTLALGSIVTMDPAAVVVTIDVAFALRSQNQFVTALRDVIQLQELC